MAPSAQPRADEAFVDLNCASLSREFLETELFGHEKGAFTGAVASKPGLLEMAQAGTLFLDEIGDLDPEVRPTLLKVLEEKRFRRLGDVRDRRADVRLVAATHQDLGGFVRDKRFRSAGALVEVERRHIERLIRSLPLDCQPQPGRTAV